jgi:hypothetical protein
MTDVDTDTTTQQSSTTTGTTSSNPYYSRRKSSFAVSFADDDGIRNELNRLSLNEELMRQELWNAIATLKLEDEKQLLYPNSYSEQQQLQQLLEDEEEEEGVTRQLLVDEDDGEDNNNNNNNNNVTTVTVQEEVLPSQAEEASTPWYARLLHRKPTLEQEIKRRKEILRQELANLDDGGLEDAMEVQQLTQGKFVTRARFQGAVRKIRMGNLIHESLEANVQHCQRVQNSLEATIKQKDLDVKSGDAPKRQGIARV